MKKFSFTCKIQDILKPHFVEWDRLKNEKESTTA